MIRVGIASRRWRATPSAPTTTASSSHTSSTVTSSQVRPNAGWIVRIKSRGHSGATNVRHPRIFQTIPTKLIISTANVRSTKGRMIWTHYHPAVVLLAHASTRIEDAPGGQVATKVTTGTGTAEARIQIFNSRSPAGLWDARSSGQTGRIGHTWDCRSQYRWNLVAR